MAATNTLLSANTVLYKAIAMVRRDAPAAAEPFRITVQFSFPSPDLTCCVDEFAAEHLVWAIDEALEHRRPDDGKPLPEPKGVDMAAKGNWHGVSGVLIRNYDINTDQFPTRIEMRVMPVDAATED